MAGATISGAMNYVIFSKGINAVETSLKLARGAPGSYAMNAGAFGCMPNVAVVGPMGALAAEITATGLLVFLISGITDPNRSVPDGAGPALVGATVCTLIGTFGAVTGCCMNPARDLGPRLVTAVAGWGGAAMQHAWLYSLGPMIGAVLGGFLYNQILRDADEKTD
jgi:glycerol uptake facilitator-like aquaporin